MGKLGHYDEFKQIIGGYRISAEARKKLDGLKLVLLLAPTSSGRNTLAKELLKTGEYHYIISDTTRNPRMNDGVMEQNGVEYWFRSEEEILADLQAGKYLEAELIHQQQVSGVSMRELIKAKAAGKIAITDIEIKGAQNVIEAKPDAISILVLPPSFDEWQRRIKDRGDMDKEEFRRRMQTAISIFSMALHNPYFIFVINDNLHEAAERVYHVAKFGTAEPKQQELGKALARQLYEQTKKLLS